jgi:uncharacterized repeat protein (TIGR04076 family)
MTQQTVPQERIEHLRKRMKEKVGWTDEELDALAAKQWSFVDRFYKLRHYKIIAEVVRVIDHCELNPKIGDKFVMTAGGTLIPEETTFPTICIWALAGIFPLTLMIMDRLLDGLDPNQIWRDQACCNDLSVREGGLGKVVFRVYCEEV